MISISNSNFVIAIPEIYIILVAFFIFLFGIFKKTSDYNSKIVFFNHLTYLSIIVIVCSLVLVYSIGDTYVQAFNSLFIISPVIYFFKLTIVLFSLLVAILSRRYLIDSGIIGYEYIVLMLFILAGNMLLVSSNDFLSFYVALEFVSICTYVLIFMNKDNIESNEAGLKYFILGALGTGFLLYGISLVYGFTGKTNFLEIKNVLELNNKNWILLLGLVMIIVGIGFKLSLAPFHLWTMDVYKGSRIPIVLLLSVILKTAILVVFIRILWEPFYYLYDYWKHIIVVLVVLSAIIGFVGVIFQTNIKSFIAYSSIANIAYVLMSVLNYSNSSFKGMLMYMLVYGVSIIGFVGCLMLFKKDNKPIEYIHDLVGISKVSPYLTFVLSVFLFSMAGIPITAGFFSKIMVLSSIFATDFIYLGVLLIFLSVVMMFYYLKIIKIMYFDASDAGELYIYAKKGKTDIVITVFLLFIFILGFVVFIPILYNIFSKFIIII